jgi:hypothetical protein
VSIVDPQGEDRDPVPATGTEDDHDPLELPDEDQLIYDLSGWSPALQAAAVEALADAGIPHAWSATDLVMHARYEALADAVLDAVEREGRAEGEVIEDGTADSDGDPGAATVVRTDGEVEYDLAEWSELDRATIDDELSTAEVPFHWEEPATLVIAAEHEPQVDALLDRLEAAIDEPGGEDSPLAELFLAVDALEHKPNDRDSVLGLNAAFERAEAAPLPYGMAAEAWDNVLDGISDLLDLALESDDADDVRVGAAGLRERLRPYV